MPEVATLGVPIYSEYELECSRPENCLRRWISEHNPSGMTGVSIRDSLRQGEKSLMSRMGLSRFCFACVVLFGTTAVRAQNLSWAQAMFEKLNHDFGVVARGADVTYRLKIVNKYPGTVQIGGVRTSCGCISASLSKDVLLSQEEGFILLTLNTRQYTRDRNADVTVTFNRHAISRKLARPRSRRTFGRASSPTPGSAEFRGITKEPSPSIPRLPGLLCGPVQLDHQADHLQQRARERSVQRNVPRARPP